VHYLVVSMMLAFCARGAATSSAQSHDPSSPKSRGTAGDSDSEAVDTDTAALMLALSDDNEKVSAAAEAALIARFEAVKAVAESRKRDLEEHHSVYTVTNRIGYGIATVVHVILAITMWAAVSEFRHASRRRKAIGDQVTEIAIGVDKVAIKTALHGPVLLVVGFGFYYLYVTMVFPIL
jgi:hypothetical protein